MILWEYEDTGLAELQGLHTKFIMYFRRVNVRRAIPFFMFLCLFLSTGGLFYASLIQSEYHYEKEHLRSYNECLVLTNSQYNQAKYRKDELQIQGRWFDVKKAVQSQGKVIVYGHFDSAELGIQTLLKGLLPSRDSDSSGWTAPVVFNFYYQSEFRATAFFIHASNLELNDKHFALTAGICPTIIKPPTMLSC